MDKTINRNAKAYRRAAKYAHAGNIDVAVAAYKRRLKDMYASETFRSHNIYPTTDVPHVYAVIAMCLELREQGLSDDETRACVNYAFAARRRFFTVILKAIDLLPFSFQIAKRWNIADHEKRLADGSIDYDSFEVDEHSIMYRISGCRYVDMFESWGIRPLCKLFCETDTRSYSLLTRHVEFVRHSDLSDGDSCSDEIYERGYRNRRR